METWQAWIALVVIGAAWFALGCWVGSTYWMRKYLDLNYKIAQERQVERDNQWSQKNRIRTAGSDPNSTTRVRTARFRASKRRTP